MMLNINAMMYNQQRVCVWPQKLRPVPVVPTCGRPSRLGAQRLSYEKRIQSIQFQDDLHEVEIGEASAHHRGDEGVVSQLLSAGPVRAVQMLFLPKGWPGSVTADYLRYQIWTFPSHVTGWMSHSLAGSSMLKALGVGGGPADSVGFSAAIKWVTKDGIGAAGRLFVGGKLGFMFDEDPKRWRMIAEGFTTMGLALEILTQVYPGNFIILAGGGTIAKAMGTGIGRPCFRVIQTHFALDNNIGDVSAKEEVWEVAAQLVGIAASVALLSWLEMLGTPEYVVPVWFAVHSSHVAFRYYSLKTLSFPWPNFKRGSMLATTYIHEGKVMSIDEIGLIEPMWDAPRKLPHGTECIFGSSWSEAVGEDSVGPQSRMKETGHLLSKIATNHPDTNRLLELYADEKYILTMNNDKIHIVLWMDADGRDKMRALWQACWLDMNLGQERPLDALIHASLQSMQAAFDDFESASIAAGWDFHRTTLPSRDIRLSRTATV